MLTLLTRRASLVQRGSDAGITLAELLVAMVLTTIIGVMATSFFVSATHVGTTSISSNQNAADARLTLDSWTSMLRMAGWFDATNKVDRFEEITPTKVVFWANLANRNQTNAGVAPLTKVALMLNVTDVTTGRGQLVQVVFNSDNTTAKSVRQLGFDAQPRTGSWVFVPYNQTGAAVDTSQPLCVSGATKVAGLCAAAPSGAGLLDPTLAAGTYSVTQGPFRGDGTADAMLGNIGRIDVGFVVRDPSGTTTMDYVSSASVSSGFPS